MLQIKNISKEYRTGDLVQRALNDVSLNFRDNEFVSILGPSGSGKTTLLNIVGGLDRYDSGDLIINNVSTKNYKDRDWDSYRNHTIGFVFQSYNLIPHQTCLANVELALTISGISKKERKERAMAALEEVGLKEHAHKKPNQMSGGQMQRVAIARALVNNPDILLADEPTGALDTETSVQVMELLKEVANDRLVIMVTHNPELAEEYSTRIVKLKDGCIIDDSNPFNPEIECQEPPQHKNLGKSSMSLPTAFSLSFNNLLTKKARTILTAFAGSIGIIGIALILSLSTGFQNYIDKIQEDTLTSYPLTITMETADTTSMLLSMVGAGEKEAEEGVVKEEQLFTNMFTKIGTNDLKSFIKHLNKNEPEVDEMVTMMNYQYSVQPLIYTVDSTDSIAQLNPSTLLNSMGMGMTTEIPGMSSGVFMEMSSDKDSVKDRYRFIEGRMPEKYNEVMLVLPKEGQISDLLLYSLGLRDSAELKEMMNQIMSGEKYEGASKPLEFTYEELMNLDLKLVDPTDIYKYNSKYRIYENMSTDKSFMEDVYGKAETLKIVGIACPTDSDGASSMATGILYTKDLTRHVIDKASKSEIVKKQLENDEIDVFSGKRFDEENKSAGLDFKDMIHIDQNMLSSAFGGNVSEKDIAKLTEGYMTEISKAIDADITVIQDALSDSLVSLGAGVIEDYVEKNADPQLNIAMIKAEEVENVVNVYMESQEAKSVLKKLESETGIPQDALQTMYSEMIKGILQGYISLIPEMPEISDINDILGNLNIPNLPNMPEIPDLSGVEGAPLMKEIAEPLMSVMASQNTVEAAFSQMAIGMTEGRMQITIMTKVGELTGNLMNTLVSSFDVDPEKIAGAFKFDMSEDELSRLMAAMTSSNQQKTALLNLISLGYQDLNEPTAISFYFKDFESKEAFIDFLDAYNDEMEKVDDEKVIKYTDLTGILMSSVKTIVDSVSYVLIAFVSISLVVSSIMIGIITYISVLERTKEIGVLRAIGASKKNISSIFNAETFIVGLFSGLIGIAVTLAAVPPINYVIHTVSGNMDINAVLPTEGAIILVVLSVILTLIGGLIPSKQAAKKDPVTALRTE